LEKFISSWKLITVPAWRQSVGFMCIIEAMDLRGVDLDAFGCIGTQSGAAFSQAEAAPVVSVKKLRDASARFPLATSPAVRAPVRFGRSNLPSSTPGTEYLTTAFTQKNHLCYLFSGRFSLLLPDLPGVAEIPWATLGVSPRILPEPAAAEVRRLGNRLLNFPGIFRYTGWHLI
jgi:hypothetical protein